MALVLGGGGETGFEACLLQPRDHNLNFFLIYYVLETWTARYPGA